MHLSQLARIELSDAELEKLGTDIGSILAYVSVVTEIAGEVPEKQLTPRYNIARADAVTNEPGAYTEAILNEAPKRHGQFLEVKKILSTDE